MSRNVRTLTGVLIALLAIAAIIAVLAWPRGAGATDPSPSPSGASEPFSGGGSPVPPATVGTMSTTLGDPFSGQATATVTRSTSCPIEWTTVAPLTTGRGWGVYTISARWYYAFGAKVMWCTNSNKTTVTSLPEYRCFNDAGFWNFDWCHSGKQDRSALGGYSVDLWPRFEYYLPKSGIYRHPHIDITVEANGHFYGTAYSDFLTICDYPAANYCHT